MKKSFFSRKIIAYQLMGYGILLFLIVGDELFDFPHIVFRAAATPINWSEVLIESLYVFCLAALSVFLSWRLLGRIRLLEGHLPICSFCKKIRHGEEWRPMEEYISRHSEAMFSHGLCPECAKKHYGEYFRE